MGKQRRLPPERARTLREIAEESADVFAQIEARFGGCLMPDYRERLIDFCLIHETREAARELRAAVADGRAYGTRRVGDARLSLKGSISTINEAET